MVPVYLSFKFDIKTLKKISFKSSVVEPDPRWILIQ
jgi:hypothetical protein